MSVTVTIDAVVDGTRPTATGLTNNHVADPTAIFLPDGEQIAFQRRRTSRPEERPRGAAGTYRPNATPETR